MSKIETVKPDVDQSEHLLRDDELDAVSGARAGGEYQEIKVVKYMDIELVEVLISSV